MVPAWPTELPHFVQSWPGQGTTETIHRDAYGNIWQQFGCGEPRLYKRAMQITMERDEVFSNVVRPKPMGGHHALPEYRARQHIHR